MLERVAAYRSSVKSAILSLMTIHLITAALAAVWLWGFLRPLVGRLPEWLTYLTLVPLVSYLSFITPDTARFVLAIACVVMLVQAVVFKGFLPATQTAVKRRRSNIPPPP